MSKKYFLFYMEIALKGENTSIYAYENISHVTTSLLIEIFGIKLSTDPYLLEGYFLTKASYKKHKKYITQNIGQLNLDVFEYCLRQYATDDFNEIRKLYKKDLME